MKPLLLAFTFFFLFTTQLALAQNTVDIGQDRITADGFIDGKFGFIPCNGPDCSTCHIVALVNTLVKWLIGMVFLFFAVIAVYAGFEMVTSGGNSGALSDAKSKFTNAFIGLIIVLAAWLMVDTLLKGLLIGGDGVLQNTQANVTYGPWSKIQCVGQYVPTIIPGDPSPDLNPSVSGRFGYQIYLRNTANNCREGVSDSFPDEAACQTSLSSQTSGREFYIIAACDGQPVPPQTVSWNTLPICGTSPSPTADGQFSYQPGIAAQAGDASPTVNAMLNCMAGIVPGNVGVISSISDSRITPGSSTFAQCRLGGCAHVRNSYHYGNTGRCGDQSYAVDFGDEQNVTALCAAANSCGQIRNCSVHNGNHVHLELPLCN